jgi:16S rRNA processing protein RimM
MRRAGHLSRRANAAGNPESAQLVELGRIVNRHGVRGELRMLPYNPDSDFLPSLDTVLLRRDDGPCEPYDVLGTRPHKRFLLLRLAGIGDADAADALIGKAVCVPRDSLPPAGPNEVYHVDLIGCRVCTDRGEELGRVTSVFPTGSNDVCVVRGPGRELLLPLVADVIVRWEPEEGEIVVRPIPGLLDP